MTVNDLTLRDYFAAQALPQLIASAIQNNEASSWPVTITEIAEKAYRYADAMMAARRADFVEVPDREVAK